MGGYQLLSQINIYEWKQWLQGMGIPLLSQINIHDRKLWLQWLGIPLLTQINIHEWKQWLQGMGVPCKNSESAQMVETRHGGIPAEAINEFILNFII